MTNLDETRKDALHHGRCSSGIAYNGKKHTIVVNSLSNIFKDKTILLDNSGGIIDILNQSDVVSVAQPKKT